MEKLQGLFCAICTIQKTKIFFEDLTILSAISKQLAELSDNYL